MADGYPHRVMDRPHVVIYERISERESVGAPLSITIC